jgi:hypothetical protein
MPGELAEHSVFRHSSPNTTCFETGMGGSPGLGELAT